MNKTKKPSYLNFDSKNYPWKKGVDYRLQPELYRVGRGEQGVLICEPYKSEIGKHWRFKTPEIASASADKILSMFEEYINAQDFVGADMARKYLQMGFTRARRYANYKGGKKYDASKDYAPLKKGTGEALKGIAADIFFSAWKKAEASQQYKQMKSDWKEKYKHE